MFLRSFGKISQSFICGTIFLFYCCSIPISFAETTGKATATLNFRASPNGRDLGRVRAGEKFQVLKNSKGWVKVKRSNGRVGWVWKKYVRIHSTPQPKKEESSAPSQASILSSDVPMIGKLVGVHNGLNVRSGPSSRKREIGTLKPGDDFQVLGEADNGWYHVKLPNGKIGYASDKYIKTEKMPTIDGVEVTHGVMPVPTPRPDLTSDKKEEHKEEANKAKVAAAEIKPSDEIESGSGQRAHIEALKNQFSEKKSDDSNIEAECEDCLTQKAEVTGPTRDLLDIGSKVYAWHAAHPMTVEPSSREKCYGKAILAAAKRNVRRRYGNRRHSGGQCAYGVRTSLQAAGVGVGALGHALQYYKESASSPGKLERYGFVNEISKYKNAANAPAGAVLVFRGPSKYSNKFLANPWHYMRGNRIVNRARGTSAGDYVGHVTIKGDDGKYYTDARTSDPAIANRYLVGIFVLKECKNCNRELINQCGG